MTQEKDLNHGLHSLMQAYMVNRAPLGPRPSHLTWPHCTRCGKPLGCAPQWGNEVHRSLEIISWSGMSLLLIMQISGAPRASILCRCGPAAAPTDGKYTTPLGWIYCLHPACREADSAMRNCYRARCKGAHTHTHTYTLNVKFQNVQNFKNSC